MRWRYPHVLFAVAALAVGPSACVQASLPPVDHTSSPEARERLLDCYELTRDSSWWRDTYWERADGRYLLRELRNVAAQYPGTRQLMREHHARGAVTTGIGVSGGLMAMWGIIGPILAEVEHGGGDEVTGGAWLMLGGGTAMLATAYSILLVWDDPMKQFHHVYNDELRRDLDLPKRPRPAHRCPDSGDTQAR